MVTSSARRARGDDGVALFSYVLTIVAVAIACLAAVDAFGGDVATLHDGNAQAITVGPK